MYEKKILDQIKEKRVEWEKKYYKKTIESFPERKQEFKTLSEIEVKKTVALLP